jgi:hypothetical protein
MVKVKNMLLSKIILQREVKEERVKEERVKEERVKDELIKDEQVKDELIKEDKYNIYTKIIIYLYYINDGYHEFFIIWIIWKNS